MTRTQVRTEPCGSCRGPVEIGRYTTRSRFAGKPLCGECGTAPVSSGYFPDVTRDWPPVRRSSGRPMVLDWLGEVADRARAGLGGQLSGYTAEDLRLAALEDEDLEDEERVALSGGSMMRCRLCGRMLPEATLTRIGEDKYCGHCIDAYGAENVASAGEYPDLPAAARSRQLPDNWQQLERFAECRSFDEACALFYLGQRPDEVRMVETRDSPSPAQLR